MKEAADAIALIDIYCFCRGYALSAADVFRGAVGAAPVPVEISRHGNEVSPKRIDARLRLADMKMICSGAQNGRNLW